MPNNVATFECFNCGNNGAVHIGWFRALSDEDQERNVACEVCGEISSISCQSMLATISGPMTWREAFQPIVEWSRQYGRAK